MKEYDISVIIPVYNEEKYLSQCIESILNQSKQNIEIVIVNDGSTDKTLEVIKSYAETNNNVVYIDKINGGVVSARIEGLKKASGKYIGWVDADDFVKRDMFEKLYNLIIEENADYVYCDYEYYPHKVTRKEKWFKQYYGEIDWNYLERNNQLWNTLTLKSLLDEINITELLSKYGEYSWLSVLINAKKTVVFNEALYYYRVGTNSLSGGSITGKIAHYANNVKLSENLTDIIRGTSYEESLADYFEYRLIYTLILLALVSAANGEKEIYRTAQKRLREMNYAKNKYTKIILDNNHGNIYSFFLRNVVPNFYMLTWLASKFY